MARSSWLARRRTREPEDDYPALDAVLWRSITFSFRVPSQQQHCLHVYSLAVSVAVSCVHENGQNITSEEGRPIEGG